VYFVTQNPADIPETVLGQLSNRVQHALRAFTPRDQKAVKTAAQTLRANPRIDTEKAITELAVGEALVSFLDAKGSPTVVERAWVLPPGSRIGALTPAERSTILAGSAVRTHYEQTVDRDSAYEKLKARTAERTAGSAAPASAPAGTTSTGPFSDSRQGQTQGQGKEMSSVLSDLLLGSTGPRGGRHEGLIGSAARSAARSIGSGFGREIMRGVLGSILGGRRR
jgi:hypothetical protein